MAISFNTQYEFDRLAQMVADKIGIAQARHICHPPRVYTSTPSGSVFEGIIIAQSNSVGLSGLGKAGSPLLANVKISSQVGNAISLVSDGLFANIGSGGGSGSGTVNNGAQYQLSHYATNGTAVSPLSLILGNRALVSDANGLPVASGTSALELSYLAGLSSAIQPQINNKQDFLVSGVNVKTINGNSITGAGNIVISGGGGGTGTVTSASIVTANGFVGTVANATTTPAITIGTTVNGLVKANGTALLAAVAGTDYLTPTGSAASLSGFPIFNQSTTGSAATLTNARNIYGSSFNGSADLTSAITGTYGGTGVNNGSRTLTLAGSLSLVGASTVQLTSTGATTVTLPLSGTLSTLAGIEQLSNKTLIAPKLGTSSTTGYVWTATDALGSGSWQAAAGGGGSSTAPATIILSSNGTYTVPANKFVTYILVKPVNADLLKIGTSAAGEQIMEETSQTAGTYLGNGVVPNLVSEASTTLYFTGITGSTTIKIYTLDL